MNHQPNWCIRCGEPIDSDRYVTDPYAKMNEDKHMHDTTEECLSLLARHVWRLDELVKSLDERCGS